jgi:O-acetyl-ADP-ribose deacetylase (regulator of RNase III)
MGDITNERTEAIVNAANRNLAHSGGVAAAI